MSKIIDNIAKAKLAAAMKLFTRKKALTAISADNCTEDRFVKHANKHVRAKAVHLLAKNTPTEES